MPQETTIVRNDSHELVVYLQFVTAFTVIGDMCWVPAFKYEFYVCKIGRTLVEIDMLVAVFWLVAGTSVCLAQPEYTTPGGILTTNCMKGCTEIAVHESNCCKYTLFFFYFEFREECFNSKAATGDFFNYFVHH